MVTKDRAVWLSGIEYLEKNNIEYNAVTFRCHPVLDGPNCDPRTNMYTYVIFRDAITEQQLYELDGIIYGNTDARSGVEQGVDAADPGVQESPCS